MKIRLNNFHSLIKLFQLSLLVGIAGIGLSGCHENNPGVFPADWNIQGSPSSVSGQTNLFSSSQGLSIWSGLIGGLQRQTDCSLTYLDFSYALQSTTATVIPNSQISRYETTLHDNALLNTTADRFLSGCVDTNLGISSRPFLFLGPGKDGQELLALPGNSGVLTSGIKSDGTYTQPATQITPIKSISLLSGDLNKDGNADVVSINSNALQSSVTVFLGNGDGTYQAGVDYVLPGANAQDGVLDDLNGDGIPDLLVSSDSPTFAFSVFIGNGDGTFRQPQTFIPENTNLHFNNAFITADVNGDGMKDIVTAQGQIFLGKGDGVSYTQFAQSAFQPVYTPISDIAPSIVAADFNHDGKMDLATDDGSAIRIYLGQGDGTFEAGPTYPTIANSGLLLATDLDGDGNIDLWTGYGGNGIYSGDGYLPDVAYALMGKGDGTFAGTAGLPAAHTLATTATAVTSPLNSSKSGASVTFHAAVSSIVEGTITGTVTFFDGVTQIGSPVEISGSSAEISTSTLKPGVHSITAKYSGDFYNAASTSPAVIHLASSSTASVSIGSPNPSSLSVVSGQTSAPFTVTVTSQISSPQPVSFSCAGLPPQLQCNFPSTPVALAAFASQSVSITIGPPPIALVTPSRRLLPSSDWMNSRWLLVLAFLAFTLVLIGTRPRKPGWAVCVCLLLVALTSLASCSSSPNSSTSGGAQPGTYAVTISALGSGGTPVSAQPTLTLKVTQ
jgi:hypothetical protein